MFKVSGFGYFEGEVPPPSPVMGVGFQYFKLQADEGFPYKKIVLKSYRSYIQRLDRLFDPMRCDAKYLPYIARFLGYNLKYEDFSVSKEEESKKRVQVKELLKIYSLKGTDRGIDFIFDLIRSPNLNPNIAWVKVKDDDNEFIPDARDTTEWYPMSFKIGMPETKDTLIDIEYKHATTYRYTWVDGVDDPRFDIHMYPSGVSSGSIVRIYSENFEQGNNGTFEVIALDTAGKWFEISNPGGVEELGKQAGRFCFDVINERWVPDSRIRIDFSEVEDLTVDIKNFIVDRMEEVKPRHLVFDFSSSFEFTGNNGETFYFNIWESLKHDNQTMYHNTGEGGVPVVYTVMATHSPDVISYREVPIGAREDMFIEGLTFGNCEGVA